MASESERDDGDTQPTEVLGPDDLKNRLAAAEFDITLMARHIQDGSHPNLMET